MILLSQGSRYSQKHKDESNPSSKFWDFSIDELIQYDVPAIIHFVLGQTGRAQTACIGTSQGSTQLFGALSLFDELNYLISACVMLSPNMTPKPLANWIMHVVRYSQPILGSKQFMFVGELCRKFAPTRLNTLWYKLII